MPITQANSKMLVASIDNAAKEGRITERMNVLGIPDAEMTESVRLAVSALLEKLDDTSRELHRTKESLSELERLVDVDCIAPIPNRRAFMRRLSWAITMHERYGHPSTVLYFDINDFKTINDTYGHAAGDLVIRHISQLLINSTRESDFLARIGGDEFALILYNSSEESAKARGAKINEKLKSSPLNYNGKLLTLSSAVGSYSVRSGDDPESALASADMSMYVDKKRNKMIDAANA